ncbi:hypothetical protein BUALT_Bualt18G0024800 [Buddleja alternifolia]|uniref:Cytochrome P450 n=1 Tax=Buddleja alternifolia TaxID=168488 RepID=A0AAV6W1N2_9LAMI|nr:hypothetical protein BUALT_Bualt18G0024800 [Buddleja alternifolia]
MAWIWTTISLVLFLMYLLQKLLNLKTKKRLPPGPRGLPILGHLHLLGKNPYQDLSHLARKHGPIMYMRFGFVPTIVISSPAAAELILKTHDLVFASRPPHEPSKYGLYGQRNLVFAPYGPYWRYMRKVCTSELFSNLRINQLQPMRKAELGLLINSLRQAAELGEIVNVTSRVSDLSTDILCLMLFGRKYADGDLDEKGFKYVIKEGMEVGAVFNLGDYFPYLGVLDPQGLNRHTKRLSKILDGFLEKLIDDHILNKQNGKQTRDFVDTLIAIMESGEVEFEFDRRHIKAVLLTQWITDTRGIDLARGNSSPRTAHSRY